MTLRMPRLLHRSKSLEPGARFPKAHLIGGEQAIFERGIDYPVFDVAGIKVGINICYDLQFAESAAAAVDAGAELLACPCNNLLGIVKLRRRWQTEPMKGDRSPYHGHRFPAEIISHAIWHYYRFCLSFRDVEDLLAKRGIIVSYETIRQWCLKFGPEYARRLKRRQCRLGDTWFLDEVFLTINGKRQYLWRAVDQDGDVIDILVQSRSNRRAAERFFLKLLKGQGKVPFRLVTDKLKSYGAALRTIMPSVNHATDQYANNCAEVSHQPTRQRERQMRRFKSPAQTQRFLSVHGLVLNLFRLARHRLKSAHHRMLRERSFATWSAVTAG